jgi:hypothetical protein
MTDKEKKAFVDKHLTKIFPQLQLNMKKICGAGASKWQDDLLQLSLEFFLEKPLDVQYESCVNNKAENFCTYIANFQLKSSTSRHWHTHRKFIGSTRELFNGTYDYKQDDMFPKPFEDEISELQECIDKQMGKLDPFEKMLIKEKVEWGSSYVEISKKYNIPYGSLQGGLKRTLKKIKERCKHLT